MEHLSAYCEAATGRRAAALVLKNPWVVNVFTEELIQADVAIEGDRIVGIGTYEGLQEIDCTGQYLCPGLIDAHMHIESTMVMPGELTRAILASGTTTVIADPHELVNVAGARAMDFFLASTEGLPVNFYFMLPSSVPATGFETNGGDFTAQEMVPYLDHPRVLGLGEVMGYPDVLRGEPSILEKLALHQGKVIDGHGPQLTGKSLQAYRALGIETDHECTTFEEVYEKLRAGMKILIREGSAAKNLEAIIQGVLAKGIPTDQLMFCTDDKHFGHIQTEGHILWNVKRAVALGMDPITAIKMASLHPARAYGLKALGAVAAGYRADLVLLEDLTDFKVVEVFKDGRPATELLQGLRPYEIEDTSILHSVTFTDLTPEKLRVKAGEKNHVIGCVPHQIVTTHLYEPIPQEQGFFVPQGPYNKLCVVERHRGTGHVAVAPIKGFHLSNGAIATSVAHDSHNIIAVGDNDQDIMTAVNHLKTLQGGYVIASQGKILDALPLPVGGLISLLPGEQVEEITARMIQIAREMGVPEHFDPFITLSFMALPVIPEIRLTDLGLFDGENFRLIPD